MNPPSIFNDVIGPVMRGPSSSHTAAAVRIGELARQLLHDEIDEVVVTFDPNGALVHTYEGQGSAMGLAAGLMGWNITHHELQKAVSLAEEIGLKIKYVVKPIETDHPNTYNIQASTKGGVNRSVRAISTGGGMIEIDRLDDFAISLKGDYYELLVCYREQHNDIIKLTENIAKSELEETQLSIAKTDDKILLNIKSRKPVSSIFTGKFFSKFKPEWFCESQPILPVMSDKTYSLPFKSYQELTEYVRGENVLLSDLALAYESARSGFSEEEVFGKMRDLVIITKNAINDGLQGTDYKDRILKQQSHLISKAENSGTIPESSTTKTIAYTSAIMEVKSAMGIIIAAPTAGSCGVLGGAFYGFLQDLDADADLLTRAFLSAGLIGVFIASEYTFAAEEGGCQVECGAASGMAAAGLAEIMGGNSKQAANAASMALQNMLGLICDPVADRVEVPCLGKNIMGATNAQNSAIMSMAGYDELIPLDQVIEAMKKVGDEMPASMCCTGLSGLSVTICAREIHKKLKSKR
jgi:L-serine dehydratase